jgi:hypothetical protein
MGLVYIKRSREKGLPEMMKIGGGVSNFEYGLLLLLFLSRFGWYISDAA